VIELARQPPARHVPAGRLGRQQRPHALDNRGHVEEPLHAGEIDAHLVDQVLDEAQPVDLARVDADVPWCGWVG
jgi:hypothetical protein